MSPATIVIFTSRSLALMGTVIVRAYGEGDKTVEGTTLDEVSDLLGITGATLWVDLQDPTPDDMNVLADELGLHHLAVEDALERHQRDKYVHYDDHLFLVCHAVDIDAERAELHTEELDVFIGDRWLVTVHERRPDILDRAATRWNQEKLSQHGVGLLVYGLLDELLDGYNDVIDAFEEYYDGTADRVFADEPIEPSETRHWFEMRRSLNQFRRMVGPLNDALGSMADRDLERFSPGVAPYLRDAAGEAGRVASEVEALRELVGQIVEVNVTLRDYRQNTIVKKITGWAAIIAVPTLVTGYYGMNVPYPGSGETWGVIASTVISVGASGGLYLRFRRMKWL
jgi:magnesium transporter